MIVNRVRWPAPRRWTRLADARILPLVVLTLLLTACPSTGSPADVAIVGLEPITYVNDSITFTVAVVGGPYDSLELRRDGELFQVMTETTFTWDVGAVAEGSYTFIARVRRAGAVLDSASKTVVVDRTPPSVALSVTPSETPLIAGAGQVEFSGTASDDVLLASFEVLDGGDTVATGVTGAIATTLTPERGIHEYRAVAVDRAGNVAQGSITTVPAYVRETHTLSSEAALDGTISAGYEPQLFERDFTGASHNWTTSWSLLHFFSFDRSVFPGALVEEATLRFSLADSYDPLVFLAGVAYDATADAPPTAFIYPFVSTVPETQLLVDTTVPTRIETIDVTTLLQADVLAGRERSQLRLRTLGLSPSTLGGTGYFAEVGDDRVPTLRLEMLVP